MKIKLTLVAVFFCLAAKAQTTPNITPAHLKAAEDVLKASHADSLFKENMATMLKQASNNLPEERRGKFIEVMNQFVAKYVSWDILKDQLAVTYAKEFTITELKGLAAFYNTPVGKKFILKQPLLVKTGADLGQQLVQSHQVELQQMMQDAFKDQ